MEYKAYDYPQIAGGITVQEFLEAMAWVEQYGLTNLDPRSVRLKDFYKRRRSDEIPLTFGILTTRQEKGRAPPLFFS